MNPYTILGALALLIAAYFGGQYHGKKIESASWLAKEVVTQKKHEAELVAEFKRHVRAEDFNKAKARKAADNYEEIIAKQKVDSDVAVAAAKRSGGLRIPGSVCPKGPARPTLAAGTGQPDVTAGAVLPPGSPDRNLSEEVGSIRLPTEIENDLFDLAEDADKLATQLRHLQKWVRDNGLYGPATE